MLRDLLKLMDIGLKPVGDLARQVHGGDQLPQLRQLREELGGLLSRERHGLSVVVSHLKCAMVRDGVREDTDPLVDVRDGCRLALAQSPIRPGDVRTREHVHFPAGSPHIGSTHPEMNVSL